LGAAGAAMSRTSSLDTYYDPALKRARFNRALALRFRANDPADRVAITPLGRAARSIICTPM
jgi:hypothetical protein